MGIPVIIIKHRLNIDPEFIPTKQKKELMA